MTRVAKIALAQEPGGWPQDAARKEVFDFHRRQMEPLFAKAAEEGAHIICFCENALYNGVDAPVDKTESYEDVLDGLGMSWAAEQAVEHGMYVIMPTVGFHRNRFQNVAVVLDRKGDRVGVYEKVHLNKREKDSGKIGGDSWPVFELDFGRIGIMICHDMHFPEAARCLALNGAEIIFWPTHYGAIWGDDYLMALLRSTAIYNGVFLASVSLGPPPSHPWIANMRLARSGVIGPRGEWRFSAGFEPGLAIGEIDLDEPPVRPWFGDTELDNYREMYVTDRRPDTYGRLMER